jgi:hypothetical protein
MLGLRRLKLRRTCWWDRMPAPGLLALLSVLALTAAGCGGGGGSVGTDTSAAPGADSSPSLSERFKNLFSNSTANSRQAATGGASDVYCPFIEIRQGASTLSVGPTGENSAMTLKYQGSFVRAARECAVVGGEMVMKVGVQGRIIVGPAGGEGQLDVPLRIAVVQESTAGSKTIVTKLIRIPVSVPAGAPFTQFTHIEEGLAFPMPSAATLENYTVFIGFDPLAANAQDKKPKPKPRSRATR